MIIDIFSKKEIKSNYTENHNKYIKDLKNKDREFYEVYKQFEERSKKLSDLCAIDRREEFIVIHSLKKDETS